MKNTEKCRYVATDVVCRSAEAPQYVEERPYN